jgi:type I restriction enzyme S subunit
MNIDRSGRLDLTNLKHVSPKTDARRMACGDVLFNNTNSPVLIGKTCSVLTDADLAYSNHMTRLRLSPGVDTRFLAHELHYLWMAGFFLHKCVNHVNQASVSTDALATTVPIAVAPTAEQTRIAEAIESYLSRLDDAAVTLERVQRNLKRYWASVLKAAVEGRLVPTEAALARAEGRQYEPASVLLERVLVERRRRWEASGRRGKYKDPTAPNIDDLPELPEGWMWSNIDQLGEVSGGLTMNATRDSLPLRLPYLRVANVYADELRLGDVKEIGVSESEVSRTLVAPDDLLVVEGNGSVDQIGRVALWDGSIPRCLHQNHLIKVRFAPVSLARWSLVWLLSPAGRRVVEQVASSTSGLHTLSISKVAALPVPICPLAETSRVIAEFDRFTSVSQVSAGDVQTSARRAIRLRQAILKWAFEGRLADQDPIDEPASALLARIKAEREAAQSTTKRRTIRARGRARASA